MKRVIIVLMLLVVYALYATNNIRVQQILAYPYSFLRDTVTLEGKVIKYSDEKTRNSKCYILQDDYGDTIKVFTIGNLPEVDQRYEIIGMVTIIDTEDDKKEVNIFENKITRLSNGQPIAQSFSMSKEMQGSKGALVNVLFSIAAFLLVVIAVLFILLIFNKNSKNRTSTSLSVDSGEYYDPDQGTAPIESSLDVIENTILRMTINSEHTLEILPGKFEFIKGSDVFNNIKLYRDITKKETEFIFGRKLSNDPDFIQLKSLTVSEKHAKLMWANEKYLLINYSTTNPTKVNGKILGKDEMITLDYGCSIEMGEIIFKLHEK